MADLAIRKYITELNDNEMERNNLFGKYLCA